MMKIGAQMVGKSVVCPDCGNRIEVPFASDPQAEALYRRMKEKKYGAAPQAEASTILNPTAPQATLSKPLARKQEAQQTPASQPAAPLADLSKVDTEQVDEWLESLWTDLPEDGSTPEGPRYRAPLRDAGRQAAASEQAPSTLFEAGNRLWSNPKTRFSLVASFAVVFLLGTLFGYAVERILTTNHPAAINSARKKEPAKNTVVAGELAFDTPDDRTLPDADALALFLRIDRIPNIPLRVKGLRVQDGVESPASDIEQQIEELGGKIQHADASGKFSVTFEDPGRFLVILVSSHAVQPPDFVLKPDVDNKLRRFFRDPSELIGNFRFSCDEYELNGGTVVLNRNFSR